MIDRITGKVYLVTGAGSGIGRSIAAALTAGGAVVYGGSRHLPAPFESGTGCFIPLTLDVRSTESVNLCVNRILEEQGHIDGLINCAGNGIAGALEDCSPEEALAQLDVNTIGALRTAQAVIPSMRAQKSGVIINISSIASLFAIPFQGLYSMSKAALRKQSEAMRMELKPFGIQVAVIEPGDMKTGFTKARVFSEKTPGSVNEKRCRRAVAQMERDEQNGHSPECVARLVLRLLKKNRLPACRSVGGVYVFFPFLSRILPYCLVEKILEGMYHI